MILDCGCDNASADTLCHKARTIRGASHRWYQAYVNSVSAAWLERASADQQAYDYHVELQNALYEHMGFLPVYK